MSRSGGGRDAGATRDLYCEIEGVPALLRGEDLTTAGFFIETASPHELDRELEIYVRSSVGELFARGQVVQVVDRRRARAESRRPGFGVLFTTLEDDQRAFIGLTLDALTRARVIIARPAIAQPPPELVSVRPPRAPSTPRAHAPVEQQPTEKPAHEGAVVLKTIAAELRAELTKLQGKTAWTALGLEADVPLLQAKEAFLRSSKRFHPHKFARHNSAEITKLATEVFIAYKRAYDLLTKLAPRACDSHDRARRPQREVSLPPAPQAAAPAAATSTSMRPAGSRSRSR